MFFLVTVALDEELDELELEDELEELEPLDPLPLEAAALAAAEALAAALPPEELAELELEELEELELDAADTITGLAVTIRATNIDVINIFFIYLLLASHLHYYKQDNFSSTSQSNFDYFGLRRDVPRALGVSQRLSGWSFCGCRRAGRCGSSGSGGGRFGDDIADRERVVDVHASEEATQRT